ncbi:MAG TPA: DoxX family protein [Fimbriimonadaceae bacterium]|jgi:putative oxidoreductase
MVARNKTSDFGLLLLRVFLFAILIYYGSQKALGLFGGQGVAGTLSSFQEHNHIPTWLTALAITAEFGGSIGVLLGVFTRLAAFGITCTMATAAYTNFEKSSSIKDAHLPMALCGIALALIFTGAGEFSLEYLFMKRRKKPGFKKSAPA